MVSNTIFFVIVLVLSCTLLVTSRSCRCVALLLLPKFCTKRGQVFCLSLALGIALAGPGANIIRNAFKLQNMVLCLNKMSLTILSDVWTALKAPPKAVAAAIKNFVKDIIDTFGETNKLFMYILQLTGDAYNVIRQNLSWLEWVLKICSKEFDDPIEKCKHVLNDQKQVCRDNFPDLICNGFFTLIESGCNVIKPIQLTCQGGKAISAIISIIPVPNITHYKEMINNIRNVSLDVNIVHNYDRHISESFYQLPEKVAMAVDNLVEKSVTFAQIAGFTSIISLVWLIFRVVQMKSRYTSYLGFKKMHPTEKAVKLPKLCSSSTRKGYSFYKRLSILVTKTAQIFLIIYTDKFLYLILTKASNFLEVLCIDISAGKLSFEGSGFLSKALNLLLKSLLESQRSEITFESCINHPIKPKFALYCYILLLFAWVCLIAQIFTKNFCENILAFYYPHHHEERIFWLNRHKYYEERIRLIFEKQFPNMNFNTQGNRISPWKQFYKNFCKNIRFTRSLLTKKPEYNQFIDTLTFEDGFTCDSLDKFFDNFELLKTEIEEK